MVKASKILKLEIKRRHPQSKFLVNVTFTLINSIPCSKFKTNTQSGRKIVYQGVESPCEK